jgi:hypothetical protein
MPIDSTCSGCGKTLRVGDEFEGRQARCPVCQTVYSVVRTQAIGGSNSDSSNKPLEIAETTYESSAIDSASNPFPTESKKVESIATQDQYYVRTPNSVTYGPADGATVLTWMQQGRLDDSCHIRNASASEWMTIPAWQNQAIVARSPGSAPLNPYANPTRQQPYQFGTTPVSGNQSAGYLKTGGGLIVLVLGALSWILCFTIIGGPICSIFAIVLGRNELKAIREGRSAPSEKPLAIIGIVLASIFLVISAILLLLAIVGAALDA